MRLFASLLLVFAVGCAHSAKQAAVAPQPGYDAELTNYEYRRPVQFFELRSQNQNLRMAYVLAEPGQPNGKTILLLHGKNFASWYWDRTIQELVEKGYRVLAPDQVGFGKSSKPSSYQFSFQTLAENTAALLNSLKITNVMVIGHSMGGMLAARFALMFPERTEKLVLVNPIGLEDWKTVVPYRTVDQLYAAELQQTRDKIREYQKEAYFAGTWKPEYEPLIEAASGWTLHGDYPRVAWNSALTADMIFTQPVLYEFPRLKPKTLFLIGMRDKTAIGKDRVSEDVRKSLGDYGSLGKKAVRAVPGAKLIELKGIGHMPQIEAFDAYMTALLDFLR